VKVRDILSFAPIILNAFVLSAQLIGPGQGITDVDGNLYGTIILDNGQEWMTSNLRVTKYADGSPITLCTDPEVWSWSTAGCRVSYDNDPSQSDQYGLLYNFFVTQQESGVCPSGWRVPTESDWIDLSEACGGLGIAGGKLKQIGTSLWAEPNQGATNELGFESIPGGCRYDGGLFNNEGLYSFFWTSTPLDSSLGWYRSLKYNTASMTRNFSQKQSGYSIRCMRNVELGLLEDPEFDFKVVPNPSFGSISIVTNSKELPPEANLQVKDVNGRILFQSKYSNFIEYLSPGCYFVSLDFGVKILTKKLLVIGSD
jgi:uncharacterized protein (TIGR02145 family)